MSKKSNIIFLIFSILVLYSLDCTQDYFKHCNDNTISRYSGKIIRSRGAFPWNTTYYIIKDGKHILLKESEVLELTSKGCEILNLK